MPFKKIKIILKVQKEKLWSVVTDLKRPTKLEQSTKKKVVGEWFSEENTGKVKHRKQSDVLHNSELVMLALLSEVPLFILLYPILYIQIIIYYY